MYQDWMDGCPLLVKGFNEHNRSELAKARDYYKRNGLEEQAEKMEKAMERYY